MTAGVGPFCKCSEVKHYSALSEAPRPVLVYIKDKIYLPEVWAAWGGDKKIRDVG